MFGSDFPLSLSGKRYWSFSSQTVKFNFMDKFDHWKCHRILKSAFLIPKLRIEH